MSLADSTRAIQPALIGLLAGLLNGLIALGGGIIVTPMLVTQRGASPQVAVGTSLAVVVVLSTFGFLAHSLFGGLVLGWSAIAVTVSGGIAGAILGSRVLAKLTARWMLLLFAGFVLCVAGRLIAQGFGLVESISSVGATSVPWWAYFGLGAVAGLMSGIFGVGGGALVLLGLAAFFGLPVQEGLPIALALNVTNALYGFVSHAQAGRVLWHEVRILIPTALVGIVAGVMLAWWLSPDVLRIAFGCFFLFMGARMGRQGLKLERSSAAKDSK